MGMTYVCYPEIYRFVEIVMSGKTFLFTQSPPASHQYNRTLKPSEETQVSSRPTLVCVCHVHFDVLNGTVMAVLSPFNLGESKILYLTNDLTIIIIHVSNSPDLPFVPTAAYSVSL
jgi:hypothetical protein